MSKTALEIAQQIEIEKLTARNDKMKKMATREGFFQCYFAECKTSVTNVEAFDKVNEQYRELFGVYRYSDYDSFKNIVSRAHKKNHKK